MDRSRCVGVRSKGLRNSVRITAAGERAHEAAQAIALATNDLSGIGVSRAQSEQLNELMLTVIRAAGDV